MIKAAGHLFPPLERRQAWALSAAVHLPLLAFLLLAPLSGSKMHKSGKPASISVELVPSRPSTSPGGAGSIPRADPPIARRPQAAVSEPTRRMPPPPPKQEETDLTVARTLMAESVLAAPQSGQARQALATLSLTDRREQLCDLEAMEQLRASNGDHRPDRLVAYAFEPSVWKDNVMTAPGAAFRSRFQWYRASFRCEVTPDGSRVTAFAYRAGAPIPRDRWEDLNLPPIH